MSWEKLKKLERQNSRYRKAFYLSPREKRDYLESLKAANYDPRWQKLELLKRGYSQYQIEQIMKNAARQLL